MEGFRILEITQPSEIHVTSNQLTVEQIIEPKKKRKVYVLPYDANVRNASIAKVQKII